MFLQFLYSLCYVVGVWLVIWALFVCIARLVRDPKTQRPKGFGFVTFESEVEAQKALKAMDGRVTFCYLEKHNWLIFTLLYFKISKERNWEINNLSVLFCMIWFWKFLIFGVAKYCKNGNKYNWFVQCVFCFFFFFWWGIQCVSCWCTYKILYCLIIIL